MKRFWASAFLMLGMIGMVTAQSDANAVKLLKSVSQKYGAYKTMSMDVTLTIENLESKNKEELKGKVKIKGSKFNLDFSQQTVICDGKTMWIYLKDVNEVQVSNFDPKEEMFTPDKIFKLAEKDFGCLMGEKMTSNGKTIQVIELTPNDKSVSYSKIKLYINTASNTIEKGVVYDKSAIHYTYAIKSFSANPTLSDSLFTFNKANYDGVDVIDLRE
jgi:outer membrane lipoprotein carrier protein